MPSTAVFDGQSEEYGRDVLPAGIPRPAIEAGVSDGWYKYVGETRAVLGMDRFGESASAEELFQYFGFTVDDVMAIALKLISKTTAENEGLIGAS